MSIPMPARKIEPPPGFEPLADAARRRGVSERTLRRQIEAGDVPAEMFQRPQGSVWFVPLPETEAAETRPIGGGAANNQGENKGGNEAAMRALEFAGELLRANAETMERQAEQIAALREERGRLTAERDAERAARAKAEAELERLKHRRWWRRWWWWTNRPDTPATLVE